MRVLILLGWLFLVLFLVWPVVRRLLPRRNHPLDGARRPPGGARDELMKDPVCNTYVLRSRAVTRQTGGTTHYFCSHECAVRYSAVRGEG